MIEYNEMDVIPFGYALYNSNWLSNDWYLSLDILYRLPFGFIAGFFVEYFGFIATIFFGRIVSYIFFSYVFVKLLKVIELDYFLGCIGLMLFLVFFPKGMNAGEWMIGGLETKVFAYSFALLSITKALKKEDTYALFFAGLALSLHLLVGVYHTICLSSIFVYQSTKGEIEIKDLIKRGYWYLIGGAWGLVGISYYLFDLTSEAANIGWDIYVEVRVPYHTIPKLYFEALLFPFLFTLVNAGIFLISKNRLLRTMSLYVLITVAISGVGYVLYLVGAQSLLRYYFFRFNDTIQPFLTILTLLILFGNLLEKSRDTKGKRLIVPGLVVMLFGFFTFKNEGNISAWLTPSTYSEKELKQTSSIDLELMEWIDQNTPMDAVIIAPIEMESFYILAKRSLFVSWKHSPQRPDDIVEWYRRIQLLNGGEDLRVKNIDHKKELARNYATLTLDDILKIKAIYPEVSHIVFPSDTSLELEELFRTDNYTLYKF